MASVDGAVKKRITAVYHQNWQNDLVNQPDRQATSLKYSNSSFSNKRATPVEAEVENVAPKTPTQGGFADFELTGDPISDAPKLEALLQQISDLQAATGLSGADGSLPDENVLTRMLANLGASQSQMSRLVQLLEQFKAPSD
jgi:hypothetical protein